MGYIYITNDNYLGLKMKKIDPIYGQQIGGVPHVQTNRRTLGHWGKVKWTIQAWLMF
jgi:hypothetical protein